MTRLNKKKLIKAVESNDFKLAQSLLKDINRVNIKSEKDFEIIGWCVHNGDMNMLNLLLKHGIDIHAADSYGDTALLIAVREGHLEMTKRLVELGLDINAKLVRGSYVGFTPLKTAKEKGYVEITKFLESKGAKF
jgi:ankyrin repeat protein